MLMFIKRYQALLTGTMLVFSAHAFSQQTPWAPYADIQVKHLKTSDSHPSLFFTKAELPARQEEPQQAQAPQEVELEEVVVETTKPQPKQQQPSQNSGWVSSSSSQASLDNSPDPKTLATNRSETPVKQEQAKSMKVGRNEPCPCGSGKKYKQCHGKLT